MLGDSVNTPRDHILHELKLLNIHARPAFPRMSEFPVFEERHSNPVAKRVAARGISLPSAANLTVDDVNFVCDALLGIIDH